MADDLADSDGGERGKREKEAMWDGWEYMRAKKRKLREQFSTLEQEQTSDIFAGVTIYVNGWTQPSAEELKRLVHTHGGSYEYNLYGDSSVTHTIASNLPHAKIRNLKGELVCTPDWIVDSVAAGRRLPVDGYLLYSRHPRDQKTLRFTSEGAGDKAATSPPLNNVTPKKSIAAIPNGPPNQPNSPFGDSIERLVPKAKPAPPRQYEASRGAAFVSGYFAYSRLHYLSTWSTELKQFTSQTLPHVTQKYPKLPTHSSLRVSRGRLIAHVDLDCFFVSVSVRDRPHLKGKPVAVCHAQLPGNNTHNSLLQGDQAPENSIQGDESVTNATRLSKVASSESSLPQHLLKSMSDIASCNYEARSAGLHNGIFVGEALKRCPELQLVPYEFDKYHDVSKCFYKILMTYSACIEPVSCDEAYLELTDYFRTTEEAERVVGEMREEVRRVTGCTVSAGVSQNMLLARMATRVAKPNGQHFISTGDVTEFLCGQKVQDLPGVGYSTALKLHEIGVELCGQLRELPLSRLKSTFGSKTGQTLYDYCRGKDERQLKLTSERKSVSVDLNYGLRFQSQSDAEALLGNLTQELQKRATEAGVIGGTLTLKLMIRKPNAPVETSKYLGHGRCNSVSRSYNLLQPTADSTELCRLAIRLLKQVQPPPEDIRGVGVQLTRLVSSSSSSSSQATSSGCKDLRSLFSAATAKPFPQPQSLMHTCEELPPLPDLGDPATLEPSTAPATAAPLSSLDETFALNLPPASQLDSSVLEALPPELTDKILRSYTSENKTHNPAKRVPVAGPRKVSPIKPRFADEGRRRRGRGRGRGRGTGSPIRSPLKCGRAAESPRKQKRLFELLPKNSNEVKHSQPEDGAGVCDVVDVSYTQLASGDHTTATASLPNEHTPIATSYEVTTQDSQDQLLVDFRAYIREWVNNWPGGPLQGDLEKVTAYFTELCSTDPASVFILLRGFRRLATKKGVADWCTAFNSILECVQRCICSNHRGTFPIEPITV